MDNFDLKRFLVENKVTANSRLLKEIEGPESITVKVTDEGKKRMNLYTTPGGIKMTSNTNPNSNLSYYIGNTQYGTDKEAMVWFATYKHDVGQIYISYVIPKDNEEFKRLVNSNIISSNQLKNEVPVANCEFKKGFEKGMKDHRGYFEII